MMRRRQRLRLQMSLSMILTAIIALFVFLTGMTVFYMQIRKSWFNSLSQENRDTLIKLMEDEKVSPDALTSLVGGFSNSWADNYALSEIYFVLFYSLIAIGISAVIGFWVASRISRPIETITTAALNVSKGEYEFSADSTLFRSKEAQDLHDAFDQMTLSLERADRELSASAAAIAHELRTPLTVLQGRLQGFRDGAFEPNEENVVALLRQVETLVNIVNDMKTLSGISERQHVHVELQDMEPIVRAAIMSYQPDFDELGFEVVEKLQSISAYVDPARVTQALNAIIENAKRYALEGKYIKLELDASNGFAELKVSDRGPGLSEHERKHVFDRWWRADKSRNRSSGGSGLGLSVVKAIVEAQSGQVSVANNADENGVAFTLKFPMN